MAIQTANLGTAPSGAGGDTFRTAATKFNENFTNNEHAACRLVGTQAGNVMEVGAFGLGSGSPGNTSTAAHRFLPNGFYGANGLPDFPFLYGEILLLQQAGWVHRVFFPANYSAPLISTSINGDNFSEHHPFLVLNRNAITDSNGFIKAASPIVQLFADQVVLNNEAQQQDVEFEKLGVGDWLVKGSSGFAQQGWYVETPKDANGNALVAVVYLQLENKDISVKTYKKKFDLETASIVADLNSPVDIPEGRWIDIRLQELPQPELVPPITNTPADFQPTGIAQAVSEMMNGTEQ
ncbi:hypothetical protein [Acinetobacter johnsonii]|uniref:phage tail fiber protein n=1 Tax=Acinetobacter johnsonii TaxID=40214 RepID=UPI002449095C|nr:hypothetical protein [Acinetobacter johnsonii]MDH1712807.1 hypothetical protein [Acinetobacter johnsonii]